MKREHSRFGRVGTIVLLTASAVSAGAAEPYRPPRTSWGDPVIQGTFTNNTDVRFERAVDLGTKAFFTAKEYEARRKLPVVVETTTVVTDVHYETSDYGLDPSQSAMVKNLRTSILTQPANGRMPPLRAEARQRSDAARAAQQARAFDSAQDRPLQERCLLWAHEGPPLRPVGYNTHVQIAQTRDHVVLITEMVHGARVIPLRDSRPDFGGMKRWQGNSWGRWEGDTLVVETIHLKEGTITNNGLSHSDKVRVIERFKLSPDGKKLISTQEFEDPEMLQNRGARFITWNRVEGDHVHAYDCDPSFAENYAD
jgi:hypothetical protein